jgi:hypothetical protein
MDDLNKKMSTLTLKKGPKIVMIEMTDGSEPIMAVIPPKRIRVKTKAEISGWAGLPPTDEVEDAVRVWYAARGQEVPAADLEMCRVMREASADTSVEEKAAADTAKIMADEKPEFGTPEFWAWARARRAAENADRAAKGLPPLLTAAQKAKAKAAKEAEKAKKS